ncbi:hypothetical protein EPN42_02415 [bacterium]|nr:MAG: hypothetical protein EPN42_02415 [bacterium]
MTESEIAVAAAQAKARVRESADRALSAIEAAAAQGREAIRGRTRPPAPPSPLPPLEAAGFEIEGLDEPLFDESEPFGQVEE